MFRRLTLAAPATIAALTRTQRAKSSLVDPSAGLDADHVLMVKTAADFAKTHFEKSAAKWDEEKIFPLAELREAAQLGFAGLYSSTEFGGSGLTRFEASLIFEQLSMSDPSTTAFLTIHNLGTWIVDTFGSQSMREEILPKLCTMDAVVSYCLTEPESGSDAASLRTTAEEKGDYYEVNGGKCFISGAGDSDYYVVMCRTGGNGPKGISCFLLEKTMEGISFGKNENKMGWNSQRTATITFDKVKVPKKNLIGNVGEGFKVAMKGLDGGRINIASCSLGAAQRSFDLAIQQTQERRQFGKPIIEFQNTQFKLAEMATKIVSSRLMIREAAKALDAKDPHATALCAMAKLSATEDCYKVVDDALQLFGGYGFLKDYKVERFLRDLRVHRILEGTNEIMRLIIGRSITSS